MYAALSCYFLSSSQADAKSTTNKNAEKQSGIMDEKQEMMDDCIGIKKKNLKYAKQELILIASVLIFFKKYAKLELIG